MANWWRESRFASGMMWLAICATPKSMLNLRSANGTTRTGWQLGARPDNLSLSSRHTDQLLVHEFTDAKVRQFTSIP